MNDAEMSQASNERMNANAADFDLTCKCGPQHDDCATDCQCSCHDSAPKALPVSAIGETNPHTGHLVIDQRGEGKNAVVLAWREREGKADYAVWRLFVTHDGRRGFDAGDYYHGQGALDRAAKAFRER